MVKEYQLLTQIMHFIPAYVTQNFIFAIIVPYLPLLIRSHGYRASTVGILLAIAEGAGILGPFIFGRLADRKGKYKGYIIISYFLTAAAAFPIAYFIHPLLSAVFIILIGGGYRSAVPLIDAVTTINIGEKGNYGKIRVSGSISFVCLLLLLQWIPAARPNTPVNIALWICICSVLAIAVITPMPSKFMTHKPKGETSPHGNINNKALWTPFLIVGLISIALNRMAMAPVYSFFPLFMIEYMNWDMVALMIAVASIAEIPFMYFSSRLIRRFGVMPILTFTSAMVALRLALYAIFPFRPVIISAQLLHSFCFGLFHPAAVAFITGCVPPEKRSFGMTLYLSLGCGVPQLLGNFIGGFVVDYAGYRTLFGCFTVFAVLGALILLIFRNRLNSTLKVPLPCPPESHSG